MQSCLDTWLTRAHCHRSRSSLRDLCYTFRRLSWPPFHAHTLIKVKYCEGSDASYTPPMAPILLLCLEVLKTLTCLMLQSLPENRYLST
jgi:hypothetical protein